MKLEHVVVPENKVLKQTKLRIDGNLSKGHKDKLVKELPVIRP